MARRIFSVLIFSSLSMACAAGSTQPPVGGSGGEGGSGGSGGDTIATAGSGGEGVSGGSGGDTGGSGGGNTTTTGGNDNPLIAASDSGSTLPLDCTWGSRLLAGGWVENDGSLKDGLPNYSPDPSVVRDIFVSCGFTAADCSTATGKLALVVENLPGWQVYDRSGGASCAPFTSTSQADAAIGASGWAPSGSPMSWIAGRRSGLVGPQPPAPPPANEN